MAFSENIKLKVKRMSAFRCCRCQEIGVEVHHIISQKNNGPGTFDNAAPLCPNCHTGLGANSEKRKEIKQQRDWWYDRVKKMYPDNQGDLQKINDKLEEVSKGSEKDLTELKELMKGRTNELINDMTTKTAGATVSGILNTSLTTSTKLGDKVHANMVCNNCDKSIGLLIGSNNCPQCGKQILSN